MDAVLTMFDVQTTVLSRVDWRRTNEKVETFRAENEQTFKRLLLNLSIFLCIKFGTPYVFMHCIWDTECSGTSGDSTWKNESNEEEYNFSSLRFWEDRIWEFTKYTCIKAISNETYSKLIFLKTTLQTEKEILFYASHLFSRVEYPRVDYSRLSPVELAEFRCSLINLQTRFPRKRRFKRENFIPRFSPLFARTMFTCRLFAPVHCGISWIQV